MSDGREDSLRELVVRGATEGERRAALQQLESALSSSGGSSKPASKGLVAIAENQVTLVRVMTSNATRTRSLVAFFGTLIAASLLPGWSPWACLVAAVVVYVGVRSA